MREQDEMSEASSILTITPETLSITPDSRLVHETRRLADKMATVELDIQWDEEKYTRVKAWLEMNPQGLKEEGQEDNNSALQLQESMVTVETVARKMAMRVQKVEKEYSALQDELQALKNNLQAKPNSGVSWDQWERLRAEVASLNVHIQMYIMQAQQGQQETGSITLLPERRAPPQSPQLSETASTPPKVTTMSESFPSNQQLQQHQPTAPALSMVSESPSCSPWPQHHQPTAPPSSEDYHNTSSSDDSASDSSAILELLNCPLCSLVFEMSTYKLLERHLNSHLELVCPMCSQVFSRSNQASFRDHVHRHFSEE